MSAKPDFFLFNFRENFIHRDVLSPHRYKKANFGRLFPLDGGGALKPKLEYGFVENLKFSYEPGYSHSIVAGGLEEMS